MRGIGAFVGGAFLIAAIFAGWWAIDRVQEHLPGPVNAVIDTFQNGGAPYSGGPVLQSFDDAGGASDPLAACPEFAEDARAAEAAVAAASPVSQSQAEANGEVVAKEAQRILDGGSARPLVDAGVAAALTEQAAALDAMATALARTTFHTTEAASLATGLSAAAGRVAQANRRFVAQGTGTPVQWNAWMDAVGGPMAQADAASKGFEKCPA